MIYHKTDNLFYKPRLPVFNAKWPWRAFYGYMHVHTWYSTFIVSLDFRILTFRHTFNSLLHTEYWSKIVYGNHFVGLSLPQTQQQIHESPLGRSGKRYEIANCVVFLASSAGSLITGHKLVSDGGLAMTRGNSMAAGMEKYRAVQARAKSKM